MKSYLISKEQAKDLCRDASREWQTIVPLDNIGGDVNFEMINGNESSLERLKLVQSGMRDDRIFASLERHMKCGIGKCGHCTNGPKYVCIDGPVFFLIKNGRNCQRKNAGCKIFR